MGARLFLATSAIMLVALGLGYFLAVDNFAIPDRVLHRSYKQFLLEASSSIEGRIIVDGGSNTIYSIDAAEMERRLGRTTLVLGDNAHYPLSHKLYRLKEQVKPGDIVLLPLEWNQYSRTESVPGIYVESMLDELGSNGFYYHAMPLWKRFLFVYRHMPFALALERAVYRNGIPYKNYDLREDITWSALRFGWALKADFRGDFTGTERNATEFAKQNTYRCDDYVLPFNVADGFTFQPEVLDNFALMREIEEETGARIVLTWPAVTDFWANECYQSAATRGLPDYAADIRADAERFGIEVIGDPLDFAYDKSCFWDTYFHVTRQCALTHTDKLIKLLQGIGVETVGPIDGDGVSKTLLRYLIDARFPEPADSHVLDTPMQGGYLPDYMNFLSGWGLTSYLGLPTSGPESTLAIPIAGLDLKGLQFSGSYPQQAVPTSVWINDQFLGEYLLENQVLDIEALAAGEDFLWIRLVHGQVDSAAADDGSVVARPAPYRLSGLTLLSEAAMPGGVEFKLNLEQLPEDESDD